MLRAQLDTALLVGSMLAASGFCVSEAGRGTSRSRVLGRIAAPQPWAPPAPRWLSERLVAAGLDRPAEQVLVAWVCSGLGAIGVSFAMLGTWAVVPTLVAAACGPLIWLRVQASRLDSRADRHLPEYLDAVARSLRSGTGLRLALVEAADAVVGTPLGASGAALARALAAGHPLVDSLAVFSPARPSAPRLLVIRALGLAAEVGGAPAGLVEQVAGTLRDRAEVEGEARSLATQARASAAVVATAPVAFAVLAVGADPQVAGFFLTPVGLLCLSAGAALDVAGIWWMARATRVRW